MPTQHRAAAVAPTSEEGSSSKGSGRKQEGLLAAFEAGALTAAEYGNAVARVSRL